MDHYQNKPQLNQRQERNDSFSTFRAICICNDHI